MFRHCEYVSNIIKRSTLGWYFTPIPWIDSNSACPPKKTKMNIEDHGTFRIYVFSMVQQEFYGTSYKNDIYIYMINIEYGLFSHDQTGQQAVLELGHPYPFLLEPSLAPGPWKAVRFSHGAHHRRDGGATLGVQLHHCRTGNLR